MVLTPLRGEYPSFPRKRESRTRVASSRLLAMFPRLRSSLIPRDPGREFPDVQEAAGFSFSRGRRWPSLMPGPSFEIPLLGEVEGAGRVASVVLDSRFRGNDGRDCLRYCRRTQWRYSSRPNGATW